MQSSVARPGLGAALLSLSPRVTLQTTDKEALVLEKLKGRNQPSAVINDVTGSITEYLLYVRFMPLTFQSVAECKGSVRHSEE